MRLASLLTVHDIALQDLFHANLVDELGLPPSSFSIEGVEFHERALEEAFRKAAAAMPRSVACDRAHDEVLADLFQVGSDAIVVPPRYEPYA